MNTPENTSTRDALLHLAGSMGGPSRYIEEMEADGQRQMVASSVLPTSAPWDDLIALGFTRGDVVSRDPLFTECTLPAGWTREGTGHSMHSSVLDERGVRRVGVFYKAAFYDRRADAHLVRPGYEAGTKAIYGDGAPVLPERWDVFTEDERDDFRASMKSYLDRAEEHPDIYAERLPRVKTLLNLV